MPQSVEQKRLTIQNLMIDQKSSYQKYLNNIYITIKQKQYLINRISNTPPIQSKHNSSLISGRSSKNQSLPKLNAHQTITQQVIQILPIPNQSTISPRKTNSSNRITNKVSISRVYQFGNFPQPKTINQRIEKVQNQRKIQTNKKTYHKGQLDKISRHNMNMLGLNVEKVNYSEKKDLKKAIYSKINRVEDDINTQRYNNKQQYNTQHQNNFISQQNMNNLVQIKAQQHNLLDMAYCQQLLTQKMQFAKCLLTSKPHSSFSPTKRKSLTSNPKPQPLSNQQLNNPIYQQRYKKYLDLLLKLTFSYRIYGEMDQDMNWGTHGVVRSDRKYKAWIGNGNNGNLLKALIKRRFWWQIVEDKTWGVNFMWTQIKNNQYFKAQSKNTKKKFTILDNTDNSLTKLDQSTSFSIQKSQMPQKKHVLKKTRVQSSLPGSLSNRKPSTSPKKQSHNIQTPFLHKILTSQQKEVYLQRYPKLSSLTSYSQKLSYLQVSKFSPYQCRVHNHLINNFYLGNKKALFYNLKQYYQLIKGDLFKTVPLTFHIKKGIKDLQYKRFLSYYKKRQNHIKKQQKQYELLQQKQQKRKMRNIWIVKPGQLTNRGNGITVIDQIYQLNSILKSQSQHLDGSQKTFIIQLYIDKPLLYKKRKFDIRHYMLITHINGIMKGYWFDQGYIRTAGYQFDIQDLDREIHLTNDAVQKYTPNYGKFQSGNKISYQQFQKYLDTTYPKKKYSFYEQILPRMKEICLDSIKSSFLKLSPQKMQHNFQLFGMDFMIDSDFVPWLIQINTNPCLQITCPLQSRLLPQLLDQTLLLTLDVIYPPPCHYPNTCRHLVPQTSLQTMKYQLIFDQRVDGQYLTTLYQTKRDNLLAEIGQLEDDQVYEDEGQVMKLDEVFGAKQHIK